MSVRVRFAPSPTGFLHVGNARTALYNWLYARNQKGTLILRIEDTDKERSSKEFETALMEDLKWMGIEWDEGPDIGGDYGPYRQSEKDSIYQDYLEKLKQKDLVYRCYCTPEELKQHREAALAAGKPPKYDNRCRQLTAEKKAAFESEGRVFVWRFKVPQNRTITFQDSVRGEVRFDCETMGDFVIFKADGGPTFHFSVVIDDALMKMTHVIRGEDHLSNTPKHILLYEAIEADVPQYAHLPLILGQDRAPLSKRHGVTSVRQYQEMGYPPEALVNYLALLGWSPKDNREIFKPEELIDLFNLSNLNNSGAVFDVEKLGWISAQHMKEKSPELILEKAMPALVEAGKVGSSLEGDEKERLINVIAAVRSGLKYYTQLPEQIDLFMNDDFQIEDADALEVLKEEQVPSLLKELIVRVQNLADFEPATIKTCFKEIQKDLGVKGKGFFLPVRLALTGQLHGPEIVDVFPALGKERILKRIESVASRYVGASS